MRWISFVAASLLGTGLLGTGLFAQSRQEIDIPLSDGRLSVLGFTRTVLDAYGYDGSSLRFPDVMLPVEGAAGIAAVFAIDRALGDAIDLDWAADREGLVLKVDHTELRVLRHEAKRKLATWVGSLAREDILARRYALVLPEDLPDGAPWVVCVHGVDSRPAAFDELREFLAAAERPIATGTFEYANDEAVDRIARELSVRLRELRERAPDRRVVLIGHSMGGLVSRYVVETPELDPGNVDCLIMLGTPNHGSRLARLRPTVDIAQFLAELGERPKLMSKFVDGLSEAGWDLWPDSALMVELAGRERNERVEYHLVLGNRGIMTEAARDSLRDQVLPKCHELYRDKVRGWLDDLDEVVDGKGDGAVSLARGRLEGVEAVVVPLGHRELLSPAAEREVFARVRRWID